MVATQESPRSAESEDNDSSLRAHVFWLRARPSHARSLFGFSDARRWVWNECVAWMREANLVARAAGARFAPASAFSRTYLCRLLDVWCKEEPWLRLVPKQALQQAVEDFRIARHGWLSGSKGEPSFKKADLATPTMRFPQHLKLNQDAIFLPKIGWVPYRNSYRGGRGVVPGDLRSATVKFEHGRWWVTLLMKLPSPAAVSTPISALGIDYGVKNTLATSGRRVLQAPTATEAETKRIRFLERRVARCTYGSIRRQKAQLRLNKFRLKITRRLHDWRHKTTTTLAKNHGLIAVEDLALKNMTASARGTVDAPGSNVSAKASLNRALLDPGFGYIREMLAYKQAWRGQAYVEVEPAYTSQTCPQCRHIHADNRQTRDRFRCVQCGHTDDADFVGAINVLERGRAHFRSAGLAELPRQGQYPQSRP